MCTRISICRCAMRIPIIPTFIIGTIIYDYCEKKVAWIEIADPHNLADHTRLEGEFVLS